MRRWSDFATGVGVGGALLSLKIDFDDYIAFSSRFHRLLFLIFARNNFDLSSAVHRSSSFFRNNLMSRNKRRIYAQ